jgi:hypothetical protein
LSFNIFLTIELDPYLFAAEDAKDVEEAAVDAVEEETIVSI